MGREVTIGAGSNGTRSAAEIEWSHNRPYASRTPAPRAGDKVLYRSNDWFDPVPAEIVDVDVLPGDLNMSWPEPWPCVRLKVEPVVPDAKKDVSGLLIPGAAVGRPFYVDTWEARLEGSAGWLPLDHERYAKPIPGGN